MRLHPHPHADSAPRLNVGIISAGKVGVALGQALQGAGHNLIGVVARSDASYTRARLRLPDVSVVDGNNDAAMSEMVANANLVVIAVADPAVAEVAHRIAPQCGAGKIVLHTAGSLGRAVLDEVALTGALTIAAHPAMTFAGVEEDSMRLDGCPWGVTVGDELAKTVAELLLGEIGGRPFFIEERQRTLYHAAMAHGANSLGAVICDAVELLARTLSDDASLSDQARYTQAAALLKPLVEASLDNTLKWGQRALTGPVVRDDVATVIKHEQAIAQQLPAAQPTYDALAQRIAQLRGSTEVLRYFDSVADD